MPDLADTPAAPEAAHAAVARQQQAASNNAARRESAMAKLNARFDGAEPAKPAEAPKPAPVAEAAKQVEETKLGDGAAKPEGDKPDPSAERGLAQIDRERKKFREEQEAFKRERAQWETDKEIRAATLAGRQKELEGKATSFEDLKKLKAIEVLDKLGLSEDDYLLVSQQAYARTPAGKKDPRSAEHLRQAEANAATRAHGDELAQVKAELAELKRDYQNEFRARDLRASTERWLDDAVKAIPSDKPTLLKRLSEKNAGQAREKLLSIAIELEKEHKEIPTAADVIAEFEKRRRSELEDLGIDVDTILKPAEAPKPAPAAAPSGRNRTLDVTATKATRPEGAPAPKTNEDRRKKALDNLEKRFH